MNRIRGFVKVVRNNPKKSIFFGLVLGYGSSLVHDRIRINSLMKVYCEEAAKYSEKPLPPFSQPRHVTVILNPVAKYRKSKDSYEKYISPILNCAGLKVSLVVTESEGQARELMEIMENTDAVIIAGGSGTIHEAVTGMLRRTDGKAIPLGIVPNGKLNSSAFNVHGFSLDQLRWSNESKSVGLVRLIAESTIAVVRETKTKINVLDVESKSRGKHVYALDSLNFGTLKDIVSKCDKYWYLGTSMKPYLAMIRNSLFRDLNSLSSPYDIQINYTDPCNGCSKCNYKYVRKAVTKPEPETVEKPTGRWWSSFVPKSKKVESQLAEPEEPNVDYSNVINDNCGVWKELSSTGDLINLIVRNQARGEKAASIMIHSPPRGDDETKLLAKGSLITDAARMFHGQAPNNSVNIPASDVQISFKAKSGVAKDEDKISIDGEEYEIDDLNISLMPERLEVYTSM